MTAIAGQNVCSSNFLGGEPKLGGVLGLPIVSLEELDEILYTLFPVKPWMEDYQKLRGRTQSII